MELIIECTCLDCGNIWNPEYWVGECPMCHGNNIEQKAMVGIRKNENKMMPYIY